ncbi:amino acid adenylation domain-containing protein [Aurantiacibacter sp. MUD11]|uniref:amino acid adenylation domain-containing protein n=1 Tax=Aurantiacibacter sp. MUD11 TaxID=3003265 RepID=UPI0022AAE973|nr:amino acid adenylation domain-containing protein [Aurantiacibacter sp. MUD11]WAT18936.1 amino acid adenylation domain-containing protein [Aurantiacibacter sp. MUD11]
MRTLPQLLENAVRRWPGNPAVFHEEEVLDYAALDDLSNRLAGHLSSMGIVRGDRVGIHLPKSLAAVVAIFAILKAGAAYVPIYPGSPPKRVALIANDCSPKVILTDRQAPKEDRDTAATDYRELPVDLAMLRELEGCAFAGAGEPSDIAYILYTSGSTGRPKGVMVSHRASLNFVDWAVRTFDMSPEDRLANLAPLSFDLSILDIFAAVSAGACVHLVSAQRAVFPSELSKYVAAQGITIWYSVPSLLSRLPRFGQLDRHDLGRLRHILFAGEPFPRSELNALMEAFPSARFHNLYGPTETNVVSHYEVTQTDDTAVPLGQPCAGHEFALLDETGGFVEGEGVGELLVSGPSLMAGYCGDSELTDKRMAPLPVGDAGGVLAYRTGDRVRRDAHGAYHFLGRLDDMVKSRGFRIELGEIDHAISSHPRIREAVAVAIADPAISNRIEALVVTDSPGSLGDLRSHCATMLPEYMIPARFHERSEPLPRNDNGKLDRARAAAILSSAGS